jgi:two-component system chemotaxis response regulator CheY
MIPTPLSVLVVDDSIIAQKKISALLDELGHTVVGLASNGAEAVTKYIHLMPDLVTMDITMPGTDGIVATQRIVEKYPSALIIMVSSHGQEGMVMAALEAGAKGYVLKPVEKDKLKDMVQKVVDRYVLRS